MNPFKIFKNIDRGLTTTKDADWLLFWIAVWTLVVAVVTAVMVVG